MFTTVLVANRGEIAVRIMGTLRRLGIRSVAVYSDADAGSRHVTEADVAVRIGPAAPGESYMQAERILAAARSAGAEAVHPGYGFLAENAEFARATAAASLVFVGPSPHAIELMGDKIRAKETVAAAGVPTVPGRAERGMSDLDLAAAADEIGFPVVLKPSAGGGGKGMRLVEAPEQMVEALIGARREASAMFGDEALLVERFVSPSRHIEVQIFADSFGRTLHLGERECSLQRRHQKVVEETPSPLIGSSTRARLGSAAIAAARSVDYVGAGTVEFIVGSDRPDEFFFLEMNTRLQVEHPVTEMVTGLDLVEHQLRVAAGEPLGFGPFEGRGVGHAIEARIYAEDPRRGFLPTGGRILRVREPTGEGIRVDSGLAEGMEVGTGYDPLLAKVVAWGADRATALARLRHALSETVVLGVGTNVSFLRRLAGHDDVVDGRLDTGLVERLGDGLVERQPPVVAYAAYALLRLREMWPQGPVVDPWDVPSGWRPGGPRPVAFTLTDGAGEALVVTITGTPEGAEVAVGSSEPVSVGLQPLIDGALVTMEGTSQRVWAAAEEATATYWIFVDGDAWAIRELVASRRSRAVGATDGEVRSPMPGTVIQLRVVGGDRVHAGQALVVIEAMKMEHVLVAAHDGTVDLLVGEGDLVAADEVVARIEPPAEGTEPTGEGIESPAEG
ncbi:MAG: acetyl/propionyl/methylcrotonyl-CoA carboxylase subunit alpha [Acidimicrobiales bacterium]